MGKKPKIIHILSHSPGPGHEKDFNDPEAKIPRHYIRTSTPPHWVGFFRSDFHVLVARETLKRTSEYDIECWRPYDVADKVYSKEIEGITHRLFPSKRIKIGKHLLKEVSPQLIREFRNECKNGNILLQWWGLHSKLTTYFLSHLPKEKIPVVVQHAGDLRYKIKAEFMSSPFRRLRYAWRDYCEKKAVKNVDYFFVLQAKEKKELQEWVSSEEIEISTPGINFEKFHIGDKNEARNQIGIAQDKILLLFVGYFSTGKGVDIILDFYEKYREKYNLELIMIGGFPENMFFKRGSEIGARVLERIPQEKLATYYNAADIYVHPGVKEHHRAPDGTVIEALACGTPVISNTIKYYVKDDEIDLVGKMCEDKEDFNRKLVELITNIDQLHLDELRNKRREIVLEHFSWDSSIAKRIRIYKKLFKKYYGSDGEI